MAYTLSQYYNWLIANPTSTMTFEQWSDYMSGGSPEWSAPVTTPAPRTTSGTGGTTGNPVMGTPAPWGTPEINPPSGSTSTLGIPAVGSGGTGGGTSGGTSGGSSNYGGMSDFMVQQMLAAGYTWNGSQWLEPGAGGGSSSGQPQTMVVNGITFFWDAASNSWQPLSSGYLPDNGGGTGTTNLAGQEPLYTYVDAQGLTHSVYEDGTDVITGGNASGISDWEQAQLDAQRAQDEAQRAYQQQQLELQRQQLAYQQQQDAAQLAAEKQKYLAQLKANPGSWLEYAAASGSNPVIQPWMLPLMPGQYGMEKMSLPAAGTPIPGWEGAGNSASGMPDLLNPSAQLLARMSPSARAQYYGYQQADTGATPEDTSWRLWSGAPPSGGNSGLSYSTLTR